MKCPACLCSTPVDARCQWCGKPILDKPRAPSDVERSLVGNPKSRGVNRYTQVYRMKREHYMDKYLREARMYMREHNMTALQFNKKMGTEALVRHLEHGNALRPSTRAKLDRVLELV